MAIRGMPRFAGQIGVTITVPDAVTAAAFYTRAFGAQEIARYVVPRHPPGAGPVKGVTLRIGDAVIQVATAIPRTPENMDKWGAKIPELLGGFSTIMALYVEDADSLLAQVVAAGARQTGPVQNALMGDRVTVVEDPFGHAWALVTVNEEISVEEHNRRWDEAAPPAHRGQAPRLEITS
jgi:uncharacterized glyoxalase superfamily protein PhnB